MLCQRLAARLGVVTGKDLGEVCHLYYPKVGEPGVGRGVMNGKHPRVSDPEPLFIASGIK